MLNFKDMTKVALDTMGPVLVPEITEADTAKLVDAINKAQEQKEPIPDKPIPMPKIKVSDLNCLFNEPQADPEVMKTLVAAAKIYGVKKDKLKTDESSVKQRKSKLREEELILFDMFQAVGITSIKADGRTYFTRVDTYASVDAGNKETAFKWIEKIGCDYLIVKAVNAQSLTREVKAYIEAEGDIPGQEQGIKLKTENRVSAPK